MLRRDRPGRAGLCDSGGMEETMRSRKQELRRQLRSRRAAAYAGEEGAARRLQEAQQLLAHAAPLITEIEHAVQRAAAEGAAPPLVAAYQPTPSAADVLPLPRRLARDAARSGFGKEPTGERLGTRALEEAALVLAPAVAVDRSGTRIGHGAGYYDRALSTLPDGARIVAVINPGELLPSGSLPREEHDVPIPEVLTGAGLVSLVTSAPS